MMNWIKAESNPARGDIETRTDFVNRNVEWWWINRRFEKVRRRSYYKRFLEFGDIQTDSQSVVGEVGPGPFGGIIEVCKLPAHRKIFIDYIMEDLFNLRFIKWPDNSLMVESPAEDIPLSDNTIDILLSYNTLDHGWDVYEAIRECIRVSKKCYLAFDCRGDSQEEIDIRKDVLDLDHYQLLKFEDVLKFFENDADPTWNWKVQDMKFKKFPVAFISVEKAEC